MPLVDVSVVEGHGPQQLRDLITKVTDAVESAIAAPRGTIWVRVHELPAAHWGVGGATVAERRSEQPQPAVSPTMD